MKYPEQFFYDLYGENIKYTMSFFALIVFGILGYIVYIDSKHDNFLKSDIEEVKVVSVFNHRGVIFFNDRFKIFGGSNIDKIKMYKILIPGATLIKTENKDSIVILGIDGQSYYFDISDKKYWGN